MTFSTARSSHDLSTTRDVAALTPALELAEFLDRQFPVAVRVGGLEFNHLGIHDLDVREIWLAGLFHRHGNDPQ